MVDQPGWILAGFNRLTPQVFPVKMEDKPTNGWTKSETMGICQIQVFNESRSNDISEPLTSNCPTGQNLVTNASHRQNVTWAVATNYLKPQPKKRTCRWEVVAGSGISIYVYNIITHIHLVYSPVTVLVDLQIFHPHVLLPQHQNTHLAKSPRQWPQCRFELAWGRRCFSLGMYVSLVPALGTAQTWIMLVKLVNSVTKFSRGIDKFH